MLLFIIIPDLEIILSFSVVDCDLLLQEGSYKYWVFSVFLVFNEMSTRFPKVNPSVFILIISSFFIELLSGRFEKEKIFSFSIP